MTVSDVAFALTTVDLLDGKNSWIYNVYTPRNHPPMKTRIVKIGNSRAVRLPKPVLEQAGLGEEVELTVEGNRIVIAPCDHPRSGWDKAFAIMAERGDDALLDTSDLPPTEWEETEWTWE